MKKPNIVLIFSILVAITMFTSSCTTNANTNVSAATSSTISDSENLTQTKEVSASTENSELEEKKVSPSSKPIPVSPDITGLLTVHYLDVGQADCILIELPNEKTMLIDAGNNDDKDTIVNYIKSLEINTIDYLIGTHPHEDHIGSLDTVINTFAINSLYMPYATTTTKTFEDVLNAVENKGLIVNSVNAGISLFDEDNLVAKFIAPVGEEYESLNNYSAVLLLTYGDNSFLFTGDAEELSENEILANKEAIEADVLKVGHHGSYTSTSDIFLKAVNPSYAIISCGTDNSYGHPHNSVLASLYDKGISIYRTDLQGTIIAKSDGKVISFDTSNDESITIAETPKTIPTPTPIVEKETKAIIVYITKTGEKYHSSGCQSLSKSKIEIDLSDAKARGFDPCSNCNPPR